jgi:hypothetical protein
VYHPGGYINPAYFPAAGIPNGPFPQLTKMITNCLHKILDSTERHDFYVANVNPVE